MRDMVPRDTGSSPYLHYSCTNDIYERILLTCKRSSHFHSFCGLKMLSIVRNQLSGT